MKSTNPETNYLTAFLKKLKSKLSRKKKKKDKCCESYLDGKRCKNCPDK